MAFFFKSYYFQRYCFSVQVLPPPPPPSNNFFITVFFVNSAKLKNFQYKECLFYEIGKAYCLCDSRRIPKLTSMWEEHCREPIYIVWCDNIEAWPLLVAYPPQ